VGQNIQHTTVLRNQNYYKKEVGEIKKREKLESEKYQERKQGVK
jgi:hypothetical protein